VSGVKKAQVLVPDNEYLVMDGGTAEKAITVASYNSGRAYWKPLKGGVDVGYSSFKTAGEISNFSSRGPVLTENVIKPTVAAPGAVIMSALNKYTSGFNKNDEGVFASVKTSPIKEFFYGANQGTSMSAPFVTGVVALWYQANPNLTHQQIMDIIAETSINDEFTAEGGQDAWGYGKINAYEGLKKALLLATDIDDIHNTDAPVSFQKSNNAWRILFNNSEAYANIRVTDLNGRLVAQQALQQAQRGEETVVSLETLPAGVYLINVTTAKANITRKVIKK
jgi:subtilisin family serine protease